METPVPLKDLTFDHRDEFDRKSIAEKVIKLLDAEMDFCPMAIDGGWGTGKTEFCHKLINLIKEQDAQRQKAAREAAADAVRAAENAEDTADAVAQADTVARSATDGEQTAAQAAALPPERAVIYLDAFASETVDDPLLCILAAIRDEFPDEETRKKISRNAVPVVKTLCKVAGKAAFAHVFKQNLGDVSEALADAASDGVNSLIDQTVDKLLDQYADAQENLDALKNVIAMAAAQRPILFFIDELDRCRPDFALSILELVKHVFDIPGIKFIFVVNLEQLKAAIRKRYGQDVDADVYLEKFVKIIVALSSSKISSFNSIETNAMGYFEGLIQENDILRHIFKNNIISNSLEGLFLRFNVSLRGVECFVKHIFIYLNIAEDENFSCQNIGYSLTVVLAIFMHTFDKKSSLSIVGCGGRSECFLNLIPDSGYYSDIIRNLCDMYMNGGEYVWKNLFLHERNTELEKIQELWKDNSKTLGGFRARNIFIRTLKIINFSM